jgi:hypothetical protein
VSRELDLQFHLREIDAAGDDLPLLFAAASAGAIALAFRATDESIGLPPVDPARIDLATQRVLAALRRCAEGGEAGAWGLMAEAVAHADPDQALAWWEAGAAAGDAAARQSLLRGLWSRRDRDALARVRPVIEAAVADGSSSGVEERYLGWMAFQGIGGPADLEESLRWQLAGAALGDADAMFELYAMRANGHGCAVDEADALAWCHKAAAAGSARAMSNLGGFYATGSGVPLDLAAAVDWYRRAVDAGSGRAAANLGVMAARGEGVPEDRDAAARWFRRAEALGYPWWEMCADAGFDPEAYVDGVGDAFTDA